jgi:alpha-glucuronidase
VEGLAKAFDVIDPEIILMLKCVPHDWEVFYPHNPAIGRYPERRQIIEFDPGAEYYGVGRVPYLYPEYIDFRLDYARARNAYGYVARVERQGNPAAIPGITEDSGLNAINLHAFKRFAEDPDVTPDQVWSEFVSKEVGAGDHVAPLIEALKLTDDVLNRCYFMLGCWYGDHSRLPSEGYGRGHIRFIAKWHPAYKDLVSRLDQPDARAVGEVMRESATAVALAREALAKLETSREAGLEAGHYQRYQRQLSILLETAEAWAKHRNAFIRSRAGGLQPSYEGLFPAGGPPRRRPSSP